MLHLAILPKDGVRLLNLLSKQLKDAYLLCFERNIVIISNLFQKLTPCLGNSVCGILQANSKGVTKVPYCNCSLAECPMTWDPYDGKSLTQSTSDQYKVRNHPLLR